MVLFVNACVRTASRTEKLARSLLEKLPASYTERRLSEFSFPKVDQAFLDRRDELIRQAAWDDPLFELAVEFASADAVVVAAPFWDLSFPALLKQYFEQINVTGVTFRYSPEGIPQGLCRAQKLWYITTAGGPITSEDFGYGYVRALAQGFYQIPETILIKAEGLDLPGTDVEAVLRRAEESMEGMIS